MGIDTIDNQKEKPPRKKFVEDSLKLTNISGKDAENIKKVNVTRLSSGEEMKLQLTSSDILRRDGWHYESVKNAEKGSLVFNITGEIFEVLEVKKYQLKIKNHETGEEGFIDFEPRKIKAHKYRYEITDVMGKTKEISIYDLVYRDKSLDTCEFIDDLVAALPAQHLNAVDEIRLDKENMEAGGIFREAPGLISNTKTINLYLDSDGYNLDDTLETLYHELGHALISSLNGNPHPGKKWKQAMEADGNEISEYSAKTKYPKKGDHGEIEDVAETIRLYLSTDGAKSPQYATLRKSCENRFKILDELFENPIHQQRANTSRAIKFLIKNTNPLA